MWSNWSDAHIRMENRIEGNLKGSGWMSREWVLKTLVGLGLSQVEAEIYLFLAQTGPLIGTEIACALKLYKQQLYRSLRNLKCKGCVKATPGRPALFSAVSLEEVLDLFMKSKVKQAKILQANRDELLSAWRSLPEKDNADN